MLPRRHLKWIIVNCNWEMVQCAAVFFFRGRRTPPLAQIGTGTPNQRSNTEWNRFCDQKLKCTQIESDISMEYPTYRKLEKQKYFPIHNSNSSVFFSHFFFFPLSFYFYELRWSRVSMVGLDFEHVHTAWATHHIFNFGRLLFLVHFTVYLLCG